MEIILVESCGSFLLEAAFQADLIFLTVEDWPQTPALSSPRSG